MGDIEISPLAKRLAEENNVNWRHLRGSGDDGKVVERDVLDYLARVMAGEEDPDPTPEPLPPGMDSWTDRDTAEDAAPATSAGGGSAAGDVGYGGAGYGDAGYGQRGSGGGADTVWADAGDPAFDLTAEDEQAADGPDPFRTEPEGEQSGSYPLAPDESAIGMGPEEADLDDSDIDEGIFVFDDEPVAPAARGPESGPSSWADDVAGFDGGDEASAEADFVGDDFFTLSEDEPYGRRDSVQVRPAWQGVDEEAGATDPGTDAEPHDGWPVAESDEDGAYRDQGSGAATFGPAPWDDDVQVPAEEDEAPLPPAPWDAPGAEGEEEPYASAPTMGIAEPTGEESTPWERTTAAPEAAGRAESSDRWGHERQGLGDLPAGVTLEEEETRVAGPGAGVPSFPAEADLAQTTARGPVTAPAISSPGMVLRREVELKTLIRAQQAAARELGLAELPPTSFLLRAAVRSGLPWPLAEEGAPVALALLSDEGVELKRVEDASRMPFRDLVAACSTAGADASRDPAASPALVVADLSGLGIDEALLDLDRPLLTLGRIVPRGGRDRYAATLTLSGPIAPDAGSRFLNRVVELLNEPIRLVL